MFARMNDKESPFRRGGFLFRRSTTGQVTLILIRADLWVAQEVRSRITKIYITINIHLPRSRSELERAYCVYIFVANLLNL